MKVTTKGQVTIPRDIREKAGILPGCEVEFVQARDGRVFVRKIEGTGRAKELIDRMRGKGTVRMTTDQIMALMRGPR